MSAPEQFSTTQFSRDIAEKLTRITTRRQQRSLYATVRKRLAARGYTEAEIYQFWRDCNDLVRLEEISK